MYVAVKGGEQAIHNAHKLLASERRGDTEVPELSVKQIVNQMAGAVDRVMTEGSLYDRTLAALAIKQAGGDLVEAIFLLRAYRTTLPRFGYSAPVNTTNMVVWRRISATYKDVPGGQLLGPTYDYTHRLLDFSLAENESKNDWEPETSPVDLEQNVPRVLDQLDREGLVERYDVSETEIDVDITREPLSFPSERSSRLQNLARGDEGFLLALGYSTQRGYGRNHPFAGEIRQGEVSVEFTPDELGFSIDIGSITITECEMINQFKGSSESPPQFTRGYGLVFGRQDRKAMSMALVDRALRSQELGEEVEAPAQDEEFVLYHSDTVEAQGFVQHLKLPHYVDFQSELELIRRLRRDFDKHSAAAAE